MQEKRGDLQVNYENSQFLLKKLKETDSNRIVKVNFSPIHNPQFLNNHRSSINFLNTFPVFNSDNKIYMPAFIVPADQKSYKEQQNLYMAIHERKIQEAIQEKNDIFVPKPSKKNSCCIICRCLFDDYLSHVTSPQHQVLLKRSIYNKYIQELCDQFKNDKEPQTKETIGCQQNINEKPRKKRKVSQSKTRKYDVSGASTMIDSQLLFQIKAGSSVAA